MSHQDWIFDQTKENVEQWDNILVKYYPEAELWMSKPNLYLNRLTVECNYLNAVKSLDWNSFLKENSIVLDVACGGGWLTAYLSKSNLVNKIFAIDSSKNYLLNFLPVISDLMSGDMKKIITVQGLFSPILMDSDSVDLIVISSAAHHASNLGELLDEFNRVLKKDGYLLILNETPTSDFRFLLSFLKAFYKMFTNLLFQKFKKTSASISASGFKYDPILGDIDYPMWYWKKSIIDSQFQLLETINSDLTTVVDKPGRFLKHFICRK
jgi:ubiquinone/menaquinone biosynthesis C-methylase UbiE